MPEVFRTENPLLYTQLEGVIVTERQPLPSVISAGTNNCILIGLFERGPGNTPTFVTSISEMQSIFGDSLAYTGNRALRLKGWSNVRITRVVATDAVKASWTQVISSQNILRFTAKDFGAFGNSLTVSISDGDTSGTKRFTFRLGNLEEVFNNVEDLNGKSNEELAQIFSSSILIDVTDAHATQNVTNTTPVNLTSGSDGNPSAADYKTAIDNSNVNVSGKIYFTDQQTTAIKSNLVNFINTEQAGQCVIGPNSLNTTVADAISDASNYTNTQGRVMYAYNPVSFRIDGNIENESPVFLAASILSLLPPHISPAAARSTNYTQNAVGVQNTLSRGQLIQLREAGIMAFEDAQNIGVKLVSGVTVSNGNYSVLRRRMSDFYINSVAAFLQQYQDEPNSLLTRSSIKASIQTFDENLIFNGILPSDDEVDVGRAFSIRTEGITTDSERAQGILKIEIKRRLFPAARFLVLIATIGESVVVEESN